MFTYKQSYTTKVPPKFTYSTTTKKSIKMQDHDPKEDECPRDDRPYEGPVEINYPEPQETHIGIGPEETHYFKDKKSSQKVKYKLKDDDDDDYIEVPGGSDTVPYTDDEGNQYEIPLDDLIEYDGDDGEIQYTSGKKPLSKRRVIKKSPKKKVPASLLMHKNIQLAMLQHTMNQQRIYS